MANSSFTLPNSVTGQVFGPASATDNAVARFDLTTGKIVQNSAVLIADTTGVISGTQGVTLTGSSSGTTAVVATAAASGTITLPAATDTLVGKATTDTLTNKRVTARTGTVVSHAQPTINTDNVDFFSITGQTEAITSMTNNLSGTPTEGQKLWIAITGTAARGITWGSSFEASTVALPTTTVTTARLDVGFVWNTVTSKWRCVASAQENKWHLQM